MKSIFRSVAAGLLLLSGAVAFAQEFPTRTVKIVVPYGPGTGIDLAARLAAERLTRGLGQPFVVENRPGAAGTVGTAYVAASTPDGYTLLANASSHTMVGALMKNLSYDGLRDFVQVGQIAESSLVLVTSKVKGYQTVKDLVAAGKAKPGSLTFASAGVGTVTHLAAEKFRLAAGFTALHVPFKSTTDALAEIMSGRIDYLVTTVPSALGPVKDGRMVALAMGLKRTPQMPNVPTLAEAGVPNAESHTWFGLFAPAKVPRDVIVKINRELMKGMAAPETKERIANMGAESSDVSLEEFDIIVKRDFVENEKLIKAAGVKLD